MPSMPSDALRIFPLGGGSGDVRKQNPEPSTINPAFPDVLLMTCCQTVYIQTACARDARIPGCQSCSTACISLHPDSQGANNVLPLHPDHCIRRTKTLTSMLPLQPFLGILISMSPLHPRLCTRKTKMWASILSLRAFPCTRLAKLLTSMLQLHPVVCTRIARMLTPMLLLQPFFAFG